MHESLTATRHSGDSKRRNNLEKTFHQVVNSGDDQQESNARECQMVRTKRETQAGNPRGKERIGKERKEWIGKERTGKEGRNALETYYLTPLNIRNNREAHSLCFACWHR